MPDAATASQGTRVAEGDILGLLDQQEAPKPCTSPPPQSLESAAASARIADLIRELEAAFLPFVHADDIEVVDRALNIHSILGFLSDSHTRGALAEPLGALRASLDPGLKAVAPKAQKRVKVPEGLDLHTPIYVPQPEPEPEQPSCRDGLMCDHPSPYPSPAGASMIPQSATPETATPSRPRESQGIFYLPTDPPVCASAAAPSADDLGYVDPTPASGKSKDGNFHDEWGEEPAPVVLNVEGEDFPSGDDEPSVLQTPGHQNHQITQRLSPALRGPTSKSRDTEDTSGRRKHRRKKNRDEEKQPKTTKEEAKQYKQTNEPPLVDL